MNPADSEREPPIDPDASGVDHDVRDDSFADPPRRLGAILLSVGPGLIVAGSIVGSGELIATTKSGAEAGFTLLWLIVLGCVIKVFLQIEFGRHAIVTGQTPLRSLATVPGPRVRGRGNWLVWYWLVMWLASISQLGGIVGTVGQAMAIATPVTQSGRQYNERADARAVDAIQALHRKHIAATGRSDIESRNDQAANENARPVGNAGPVRNTMHPDDAGSPMTSPDTPPIDPAIWAAVVAVLTSGMLVWGRFGMIQTLSTVMVASFTLLTIANLVMLQNEPMYAVSGSEFLSGFRFRLPDAGDVMGGAAPIKTALATFGIIGVGAAELVVYPYWCLEKGYAKSVGRRPSDARDSSDLSDPSDLSNRGVSDEFVGSNDPHRRWLQRARGWMRVMQFDAYGSMVVYTFATIAFYLLGAATLNRLSLNPEDSDLVRTLAMMYVPVFSDWARVVFLIGAVAVLYSTFFVANASHARTFSDALRVIGVIASDEETRSRWIRILSGVFPLLCVAIYVYFPRPAQLVLISGIAQGVMLPMLAGAAIYFRRTRRVPGLSPGWWWDVALWTSGLAMLATGTWTAYRAIAG